jgi:multiple sugar transport system substrate-binding protein
MVVCDSFPPNVRRWAVVCLVGLIGALAAGCALAAPAPEPVTISFIVPEFDAEHYEALLPDFAREHPEITVELRPNPYEDVENLEPESADVILVSQYLAIQFFKQGKLLSLDSLVEQDETFQPSAFYPGALDAFTYEGETWAIPYGVDMRVMYYNRELFDRYGVPYPEMGWTWDDFLERAVAIRDPDAFVFGYGPRLHLPDATAFILQHGGQLVDDPEDPTRTTFDDPLAIEALEWYARMVHDYDAAPSLNQSSHHYGGGSFGIYQGILINKVGMWMGGLSERGGLVWPVKWKMEWGMVPLPRGRLPATEADVEGYAILRSTEHPDACWEWIAWLNEQVSGRLLPARRSLAESSAYEDRVGPEVAAVTRASMAHAEIVNLEGLLQFEGALEAYEEALEAILQGFATPYEAMSEAQQAAQRAAR